MLYFIRHASAEDAGGRADVERRLSERGEGEARRAGRALRKLLARPEVILSSPAVRARETARLIAEGLEAPPPIETRDGLYGGTSPEEYLRTVEPYLGGSVAVVSHQPDLSHFVRVFAGVTVSFMPSSVCCLEIRGGRGHLLWIKGPNELAAVAGNP